MVKTPTTEAARNVATQLTCPPADVAGKKVPAEAIKNFDEEAAINIVSNTFHDFKDNAIASAMNYQCSFNPIDKIVELYEALVKSEKEKVELLQKLLDDKK